LNPLIYGKDTTKGLTAIEYKDGFLQLFTEQTGEVIISKFKHWVLTDRSIFHFSSFMFLLSRKKDLSYLSILL